MNPPEVTQVEPKPETVASPPIRDAAPLRQGSTNLVLATVPEGAEILLDDILVGMTPSRLTIAAGTHKIVFRKQGFKDYERRFMALKDSDLTVSAEMEKD